MKANRTPPQQRERQKRAAAERAEKEKVEQEKVAAAEAEATPAAAVDPAKQLKKVQKQLRQIDALKEKASSELNAEQLQKLSRETDLRKQEAELKAALA